MADKDSGIAFVSGFLLGGLVGAAIGLLVAPKSGAETRANIVEQSEEWRHQAQEIANQISQNITPTIDSLRQQVSPAVGAVRERMGMEHAPAPAETAAASADEDAAEAAPAAKTT